LYIKQKLYERQEPKKLIEKFTEEIDQGLEWQRFSDDENLKKEYKKLKWKFENKKIMEKLIRKWFIYDDVKNVVFK
jgi:SOS response regulatory protein OraA/RecX